MTADAQLDLLFTSGATMTVGTAEAPCDLYDQDAVEQEGDYAGLTLNSKTVLVRASAFPELVDADSLSITDADGIETQYTVAGTPRRIQDGKIYEINLRVVS